MLGLIVRVCYFHLFLKREKWNYHHMISESPKGLLWQPVFPQWLEQCLSRKCVQIYWMVRWLEQENVRSMRARTLLFVCCPSAQNCSCRTVNTQYAQLSPSSLSIYYSSLWQSWLRCSPKGASLIWYPLGFPSSWMTPVILKSGRQFPIPSTLEIFVFI